jgi:hypothetical protein
MLGEVGEVAALAIGAGARRRLQRRPDLALEQRAGRVGRLERGDPEAAESEAFAADDDADALLGKAATASDVGGRLRADHQCAGPTRDARRVHSVVVMRMRDENRGEPADAAVLQPSRDPLLIRRDPGRHKPQLAGARKEAVRHDGRFAIVQQHRAHPEEARPQPARRQGPGGRPQFQRGIGLDRRVGEQDIASNGDEERSGEERGKGKPAEAIHAGPPRCYRLDLPSSMPRMRAAS